MDENISYESVKGPGLRNTEYVTVEGIRGPDAGLVQSPDDLAAPVDEAAFYDDLRQSTGLVSDETLSPSASDSSSEASSSNSTGNSSLPLSPTSSSSSTDLDIPPIIRKTAPGAWFSNEYFHVAKSDIAGWGAIALKDLEAGQVILRELPIFKAERELVLKKFRGLSKSDQAVCLDLYGHKSKQGNFVTSPADRAGLFPVAARLNHACNPSHNVAFRFDRQLGCLVLTVRAGIIKAGEELTICYVKHCTALELYWWYGFRCECGTCEGVGDETIAMLQNSW